MLKCIKNWSKSEEQRTASKRDMLNVSKSFRRRKNEKQKYHKQYNFSEEEKETERQYEREHFRNVSDDQNQRIVEYEKNIV